METLAINHDTRNQNLSQLPERRKQPYRISSRDSIGARMMLVMSFSPFIEYDEYMEIVAPNDARKAAIQARGLSLSFGVTQMRSYLQLKHDFKEWFLSADEYQRSALIVFVEKNISMLMKRSINVVERHTQHLLLERLQRQYLRMN